MAEIKIHIFAFAIIAVCLEIFLLAKGDSYEFGKSSFVFASILFFFLFTVLEYIFNYLVESKAVPLFSLLPSLLLYVLLKMNDKWSYLAVAVLIAVALRIAFDYLPARETIIKYGCIILDFAAIFFRVYWGSFWGDSIIDKLVFIALTILTLSTFQHVIWGRKKGDYPFYYFMMLGIMLIFLPTNHEPIDWSQVEGLFGNAADATAYYFDSVIGDKEYTVGYGSFKVGGGKVSHSNKLQLVLESVEKPYFVYTDEETDKKMKMRRTIYLAGAKGVDGQALVEWLQFLYDNGVTKEEAAVFSQVSKLEIQYVYLKTADEIAPANAIFISNQDGAVLDGRSDSKHKKGYKLKAKYLDIDYGSPKLISLYRNPAGALIDRDRMTYRQASDYYLELYNQSLSDVMDAEKYSECVQGMDLMYLYGDTTGSSDRMKKLVEDITAGAENDYDKAKAIENYLRQYTYSTTTVGGHKQNSDMTTAEGMADIADRFLFETEKGYCVHYTSSMVMLLRLAGIPARAENGFRFSFPFEVQEKYVVEANCAHVWPEAYIQNVGWVPFEPTSAYSTAADYTWHRKGEKEPEAEVLKQELERQAVPDIPEVEETQTEAYQAASYQLFKIIGIVVLSIIALILLIIVITNLVKGIVYKYASPEQKIKIDVGLIKESLLRQSQGKLSDRGLLSDYIAVAPKEIQDDVRRTFEAYYRIIYGDISTHPISQEEGIIAKEVRDSLRARKRKDLS